MARKNVELTKRAENALVKLKAAGEAHGDAVAARETTMAALKKAIIQADKAGAPKSLITEASGTTRTTVHLVLKAAQES
jgi:hypothetical protein